MIPTLAWRNLWRNKRRTLITTASVTFAVVLAVTMQSLQKGVFDNLIREVVGLYYGYVQIHRAGYWDEPVLDNSIALDSAVLQSVAATPGVNHVVPRLESFCLSAGDEISKGCLVIGTDPQREDAMTQLSAKVTSGRYFTATDKAVLLGEGLAEKLQLTTGDTMVLLGQGYHGTIAAGKFVVIGLVHFGTPDLNAGVLYMPLPVAQELFSTGPRITSLAIGIQDPADMFTIQNALTAQLDTTYEIMNWEQLMPDVATHIRAENLDTYIYTGILYVIIAFGIFGTILMMTAERRFEFGILLAIGMYRSKMAAMLVYETMLISLLGVLAGMAVSVPIVLYLQWNPIRFTGDLAKAYSDFGFEPIFPAILDVGILIFQSSVVLIIALVVSIYPLVFVKRLHAVKAMKK